MRKPKKKLDKNKIRAKLVRKGVFTLFPYVHKSLEKEHKFGRIVLDRALFYGTSKNPEYRKDFIHFINPESSCAEYFNTVSEVAGLYPTKTRQLLVSFVDKFFPEVFSETSCSFNIDVLR